MLNLLVEEAKKKKKKIARRKKIGSISYIKLTSKWYQEHDETHQGINFSI